MDRKIDWQIDGQTNGCRYCRQVDGKINYKDLHIDRQINKQIDKKFDRQLNRWIHIQILNPCSNPFVTCTLPSISVQAFKLKPKGALKIPKRTCASTINWSFYLCHEPELSETTRTIKTAVIMSLRTGSAWLGPIDGSCNRKVPNLPSDCQSQVGLYGLWLGLVLN